MTESQKVTNLDSRSPLFREFCAVHGLQNGDSYKTLDYLRWADSIGMPEYTRIVRKYRTPRGRHPEPDDRKTSGILEE